MTWEKNEQTHETPLDLLVKTFVLFPFCAIIVWTTGPMKNHQQTKNEKWEDENDRFLDGPLLSDPILMGTYKKLCSSK